MSMTLGMGSKTSGFKPKEIYDPEGWAIGYENMVSNTKEELNNSSPHIGNILHKGSIKTIEPSLLRRWYALPEKLKEKHKKMLFFPYHKLNIAILEHERKVWADKQAAKRSRQSSAFNLEREANAERVQKEIMRNREALNYDTIMRPNKPTTSAGKPVVVRETVLMSNAEPTSMRDKFMYDPFKKSLNRQHPLVSSNSKIEDPYEAVKGEVWGCSESTCDDFSYSEASDWGNDKIRTSDVKIIDEVVENPMEEARANDLKTKTPKPASNYVFVHPLGMNAAARKTIINAKAPVHMEIPFITKIKKWVSSIFEPKPVSRPLIKQMPTQAKAYGLQKQSDMMIRKDPKSITAEKIQKTLPNKIASEQVKNGIDPMRAHTELLEKKRMLEKMDNEVLIDTHDKSAYKPVNTGVPKQVSAQPQMIKMSTPLDLSKSSDVQRQTSGLIKLPQVGNKVLNTGIVRLPQVR